MQRETLAWLACAFSVLLIVGYELRLRHLAARDPTTTARSAHRLMRGEWVEALSGHPGSELLAVQALRNSLMSATINASTAVLVLMGSISLMVANASRTPKQALDLRLVLELAFVLMLFATYVCAAMAMRYYNHAGFAMSLPVGSPARGAREMLASLYVQRAGILYSWSLRCFLFAVPPAFGVLSPLTMPVVTLALIVILTVFDRVPDAPCT